MSLGIYSRRALAHRKHWRCFSTRSVQRVCVPYGSTGSVTIDLHNLDSLSSSAPLMVYLPPFPHVGENPTTLPACLKELPVATINYHWDKFSEIAPNTGQYEPSRVRHWPAPVHDTATAFAWLKDKFTPQRNGKRAVYAHGSYLGASLATSLALTEAHAHMGFSIRGLVALNGIYNWTMFLPDHRINRPGKRASSPPVALQPREGSVIHKLYTQLPSLFSKPDDLFDPFASPSLFFHNPGLHTPESFYMSSPESSMIDVMVNKGDATVPLEIKQPRKSYLIFPARWSTLKIPQTLLLHDSGMQASDGSRSRKKGIPKVSKNSFATQASELIDLMKRSIELVELKERRKWDENIESLEVKASRRIQVFDVGLGTPDPALSNIAEQAIYKWVQDRM